MSNEPVTHLWEVIERAKHTGGVHRGGVQTRVVPARSAGEFKSRTASVPLASLADASLFAPGQLEALRGRSVLLATRDQLATAIALIELDGIAARLVLCTSDLRQEQLASIAATAEADIVIVDGADERQTPLQTIVLASLPLSARPARLATVQTEWILLTSGTTGEPKLVLHTLSSLAGALPTQPPADTAMIWSTFYDIRRYGGLQIYLRAVLTGSTLVLSSAGESTRDFLERAGTAGVTHISGTPSHWRRALMSGETALFSPGYVRLSGEVADQPLLDNLRTAFPHARLAHAFASTEAGVAFDVNDGLAGFPAEFLDHAPGGIVMKVEAGTLRIRSGRNAARYLGSAPNVLVGEDGYVDTGDMVELKNGRYYFRGRAGGVINVGGMKVFPEEVEAILNADSRVRMSLVRSRRNPITGAVVVADVVLTAITADTDAVDSIKTELLDACRRALASYKVPAMLRFVPALDVNAAGKLVRPGG